MVPPAPYALFDPEANASVANPTSAGGAATITKTGDTGGYDGRAQSWDVMPPNFLARFRTTVDDGVFYLGWAGSGATGPSDFEWAVAIDASIVYCESYQKGSLAFGHGAADSSTLRVFVRRLNGEWTVWTKDGSDDFAGAVLRHTYNDSGIDTNAFYATALLATPGMAAEVSITAL